jgi:hypothetical protein
VAKFQYMPGGHGGAGSARATGGEANSISGRAANTTADKALCCSQGFIAHLLSVAFCVEILRFGPCQGARFHGRPFDGEYAYTRWPVDLSYGLIGCREPYHLDREPYDDFSPT